MRDSAKCPECRAKLNVYGEPNGDLIVICTDCRFIAVCHMTQFGTLIQRGRRKDMHPQPDGDQERLG